ncbi:MAG TPA: OsmC family peroxiredoxin [Gaiellaceae bacterium]|nr:OsmC family peroxiredoxin [Gaiellaceae bacterium]
MATDRHAEVSWQGSLTEGSGTIERVGTGAFGPLDVSWPARTEAPGELTSPEELIAAAHAACFSMALAHELAQGGNAPERLDTRADVTFQPGPGITKVRLAVRGRVPGLDEGGFREAAEAAKAGCPVSQALAGVPEITLEARLEG